MEEASEDFQIRSGQTLTPQPLVSAVIDFFLTHLILPSTRPAEPDLCSSRHSSRWRGMKLLWRREP